MADTYTTKYRLRKMEDNSHSNTWGTEENETKDLLESAISGISTVAITGGSYSLTTNNDSADEARALILVFTGTLTSNATITIPTTSLRYIVKNSTTGSYTLTIKMASGTGVTVTQGATTLIYSDGSTGCYAVSVDRFISNVDGAGKTLSDVILRDVGETEYNLGSISAGTLTPDYNNGAIQYGTLTDNITLALPTNFPASGGVMVLKLTQDATGSRTITLNASYKKKNTITLTTTANKYDKLYISCINGVYDITLDAGYS